MMVLLLGTFIGFTLGLLGGGGSVVTVPGLIYLVGLDAKLSIALSLAIVGLASLFGFLLQIRKKNYHLKAFLSFVPTSMLGAYLGSFIAQYFSAKIQLLIFASIMFISAYKMIRPKNEIVGQHGELKVVSLLFIGLGVGVLSGVIGVGGGFLIVPALVFFAHLEMDKAVGTSLGIISFSSLTGFAGYTHQFSIAWPLLFKFVGATILGIVIGNYFLSRISSEKLKKIFGYFLLIVSLYLVSQNLDLL